MVNSHPTDRALYCVLYPKSKMASAEMQIARMRKTYLWHSGNFKALPGSAYQSLKGLITVDDNSLITVDENGCFTVWANGKQNSGRVDFSPESRLPFAQISSIYQKTAAKSRISVW